MAALWILAIPVIVFCAASIMVLSGKIADYFDQWWSFPFFVTLSSSAIGGAIYLAALCLKMYRAGGIA